MRICRDASLQASLRGLFPCRGGAGYAGGILSAAADGIRCAEAVIAACPQTERVPYDANSPSHPPLSCKNERKLCNQVSGVLLTYLLLMNLTVIAAMLVEAGLG